MANNKTKKRIGIAAAALGLFFAVGAAGGTTLAKFISSTTVDSQIATVAQWGYTLSADASNMFGQKYGNNVTGEAPNTLVKVNSAGTLVVSSRAKNVVAPGTTGNMSLTLNGSAEVVSILKIDLGNFESNFNTVYLSDVASGTETTAALEYYPIKWEINYNDNATASAVGTNGKFTAEQFGQALATGVSNALGNSVTAEYVKQGTNSSIYAYIPANTSFNNASLKINWSWAFGTEDFNTSDSDAQDTLLGLKAAGKLTTYGALPENIQTWLFNKFQNTTLEVETTAKSYEAAVKAVEDAQGQDEALEAAQQELATVLAAYETYLGTLVTNLATNSNLDIQLNFSLAIAQTQATSLADYKTNVLKIS